jgi:hypothetical protein
MVESKGDIFIITSVINTGNAAWSYTNIRSAYTPQQRYEQTLNTIRSIRALNDNTQIILVDCSDITYEMESVLSSSVDLYIQLYNNKPIRDACILSNKKGFGELLSTKYVIDYLIEQGIEFKKLFKISGRYYLNESFNKNNFSMTEYTFRKPFPNSVCHPTVLYSIPYEHIKHFQEVLNKSYSEYINNSYVMFEISIPTKCTPLTEIDTCGVSGLIAVNNEVYEDK